MSDDEIFITFVSTIAALVLWSLWFLNVLRRRRALPACRAHWQLALMPLASALLLFLIIRQFASPDVRSSSFYTFQYMAMGAAWVAIFVRILSWFGVSLRDDVIERSNPAAEAVVSGALVALTLAFAGANIGEGPGWWVVVFCALLSTAGVCLAFYVVAKASGCVDFITIDRDLAAGLRLAGFLIAVGLVLGRSVAGDWHSAQGAVVDFLQIGWPALVLAAFEAIAARSLRPAPEVPRPPVFAYGIAPAAVYVGAAVLYVLELGVYTPGGGSR